MKKLIGAIVIMLAGVQHAQAVTVDLSSLTVTSGSMNAEFLANPVNFTITALPTDNLLAGYHGGITATPLGSNPNIPDNTHTLYTAATNQDPNGFGHAAGTFVGGPVPTGFVDLDLGTITVDLSGIFGDHFGADQSLAGIATGTYDAVTGAYEMSWTKTLTQGHTGEDLTLTFAGQASVVPVPAAAWLFGSGLLGLVGLARRKA
ncbi:MAG: hypothetical protein U9N57_03305 [Pseudomonadota bacterium]|nr:hypothetical protein [Pseudomonadota bacterium]